MNCFLPVEPGRRISTVTFDDRLVAEVRRALGVPVVGVLLGDALRVQARHGVHGLLPAVPFAVAGGAIAGVAGLGRRSTRHFAARPTISALLADGEHN